MELALREAKARLSDLIVAAQNGERVIITKHAVNSCAVANVAVSTSTSGRGRVGATPEA